MANALFFVCIGVYAANNDMFQVGEVLVIGILGYVLLRLGFHPAPILLVARRKFSSKRAA